MTDKILAFVDGSLYSASVCDHAAWIAARTGAPVEVLHVLGRREAADRHDLSGAVGLGARTALLEELAELDAQRARLVTHRGRAILEDAHGILTKAGVAEITTRLRHGDIIETVGDLETGASMILIGKRGEAADFAQGHLGSNLERIVRASKKPVFVAARAFKPVKRVLVAHDGGVSAMKAIEHVARDPLFAGLSVDVASVGAESAEIRKRLDQARALLKAAGLEGEGRIVPGQPEKALGELIDKDGYDLLVMGAYGHSRIRQLIIGSTTSEMIRSCKVPVVLIR